jgi:protein-S-isoprenylcysteine O-methyltransferase Ste14
VHVAQGRTFARAFRAGGENLSDVRTLIARRSRHAASFAWEGGAERRRAGRANAGAAAISCIAIGRPERRMSCFGEYERYTRSGRATNRFRRALAARTSSRRGSARSNPAPAALARTFGQERATHGEDATSAAAAERQGGGTATGRPVRPNSTQTFKGSPAMFKRSLVFAYGLASYAIFFATFLYAFGWLANLGVPRSIDSARDVDFTTALLVDLGLLLLFAVQHSGMARPAFKRWLTRVVPEPAERSTYVLASSLALIAMFVLWQPLGGEVWSVQGTAAVVLWTLCAFGWLLVLVTTFLINHFDLFGLRQVWFCLQGVPYRHIGFRQPSVYKLVRHPLYVGWLFAFWATPTMSAAHLLFALATTGYILVAIQLEERDLVASLGDSYREYRERVPMLVPFTRSRGAAAAPATARN